MNALPELRKIGPLELSAGDSIRIRSNKTGFECQTSISQVWHDDQQGYYIVLPDGRNVKERTDDVTITKLA